jgi:hypothetical protein
MHAGIGIFYVPAGWRQHCEGGARVCGAPRMHENHLLRLDKKLEELEEEQALKVKIP